MEIFDYCLCVVFFCRSFNFPDITAELLFEFLNYGRSDQGMLKASMKTSYFLENYSETSPERACGEIVFWQLQGTVTELMTLGAGLDLRLVSLQTRLYQRRGGRAGRSHGCIGPAGH